MRLTGIQGVHYHIMRIREILAQMKALEITMSDSFLVHYILCTLPPLGLMKFLGSLVILENTVNAPNFNSENLLYHILIFKKKNEVKNLVVCDSNIW